MKTSNHIIITVLFTIGCVLSIQAQDSILNRNVTVEREYKPIIQDAGKVNSIPKILEPKAERIFAKYSDFNLPLNTDYNIHLLPAAELELEKTSIQTAYARLGFGTYLNTLVDFAYPLINKPDLKLDFSLHQLGTLESKRLHSKTKADLSFEKIFKTVSLFAEISGSHEYVKYFGFNFNRDSIIDLNNYSSKYGNSMYEELNRTGTIDKTNRLFSVNQLNSESIGDVFWRFNSNIGIKSIPQSSDIQYLAAIEYNIFSSTNGLTENQIHTQAKFNSPNNKNRIGFDIDIFNLMYSSVKIPKFNFWSNYSVLNINPYYKFEANNWKVRLGLKTAFSFVHGNLLNPSADVLAEWNPIPSFISIYAGVNGDYQINTLDKILSENPFLYSDIRVNDTYTPYNLFIGFKLKPLYNVLIDGYLSLRQIDNQYFFVNKEYSLQSTTLATSVADSSLYSNRFNVIYSSASVLKIGVRIAYNLKKFMDIEVKAALNNWNVKTELYAWNKPAYEAQFTSNFKINNELSLNFNAFYEGGRYAKLGNKSVLMNDKVDINLGCIYTLNNWISAFIKFNNILNSPYQNFYGYDVQGINFMIGSVLKF